MQIPIKAINKLSKELKKSDMLIPADIILDSILEDRADIPIDVIHMYSGLKADLYPVREGDELRQSAFQRREQVEYGPPIGKVYINSPGDLILYKLMYFGLSQQSKHSRDIAAILKSKGCFELLTWRWKTPGMERKAYPSDFSEEEWGFLAPYLTLMTEDAPRRDYSLREVFNGLRWLVRAGASYTWRRDAKHNPRRSFWTVTLCSRPPRAVGALGTMGPNARRAPKPTWRWTR